MLIALIIALLSDIPCGFSKTLTLDMEEVSKTGSKKPLLILVLVTESIIIKSGEE